jgi:hypothetical protein
MGKSCYLCNASLGWRTGTGVTIKLLNELNQTPPENMGEDDRMCGKCYDKHIANFKNITSDSNQKSQKASNSGIIMDEKYTDMKSDNVWLHRIANECAETNSLLKQMMSQQSALLKKIDGLSEK